MRIYVAASYARQSEMQGVSDVLTKGLGHEVTSRWIWQQIRDLRGEDVRTAQGSRFAMRDLEDIARSEAFIMFTGDNKSGGGRHTEFGVALMTQVMRRSFYPVAIVGPPENVFHGLDNVHHFPDWSTIVRVMASYRLGDEIPSQLCPSWLFTGAIDNGDLRELRP